MTVIDLQVLQDELAELGMQGNPGVEMRGLIALSQFGDFVRYTTHDQVLNPTVRPHENPSLEAHAAGHVLVQMMTYIIKRNINLDEALMLGLQDLRGRTVMKKPSLAGTVASPGECSGVALVVRDWAGLTCLNREMCADKILITPHASVKIPVHIFRGVITDYGGIGCHAAIVCREHHIPCIVDTGDGTSRIRTGMYVSITAAGEVLGPTGEKLL